ncbi:MAG: molybdopterin-dependent oxidoreductase [Verrucomicrobiae bacterium]|nr:molybdopterin-dependent oxidoreductase [Verrucomicrobiae bacterium]
MCHTLTTCTFCGVGCGLYLETEGDRVVGVVPCREHPSSAGRLCVRGWHVHEVAGSPERLRAPRIREGTTWREAGWDEALDCVAGRFRSIRDRYGPEAIAFLNSPRSSNEEAYLLQKLARAVIGTPHVDHGAGVYGHHSVEVLLDQLGVAAATGVLADLNRSDVLLVDGVDLARQLPTLAGTVLRARLAGATLLVVDARRHRVAESADVFLQVRPGTSAILYGAMARVIVDRGLQNRDFLAGRVRDVPSFLDAVRTYDLLEAAERCGLPARTIEAAAIAWARARAGAAMYSTADAARTGESVAALVNLVLLCGQVGRPGAGLYPLAEHNNLQGVCDVGMLPDRLPGYRAVADAGARAEVEAVWGAPVPDRAGASARDILAGGHPEIRALWLGRYDPVSTAFAGGAERTLKGMEFVAMQHLFWSGAAELAHVVLPTTAFGEETVTFTSTDRRIQRVRQAVPALPGLEPAWRQIVSLAGRLGASWAYGDEEEVWREIGRVVPAYRGACQERLDAGYGCPWPCTDEHPRGTDVLYEEARGCGGGSDGETGREGLEGGGGDHGRPFRMRAMACPEDEPADGAYPFTLIFGDSLYYWHRNVLVRHSETLQREYRMLLLDYPDGFVEMHGDDAASIGVRDGGRIRLCSEHGCAVTTARVTEEVRRGSVHVPYFLREVEEAILGPRAGTARLLPVRISKEGA